MENNSADGQKSFDYILFLINFSPSLVLFIIVLTQGWPNPLLFIFPLSTLFISFFFMFFKEARVKMRIESSPIIFNPFGNDTKHYSLVFSISTIIQLIFLYLLGIESKERPQLLNDYGFNLIIIIVVLFLFPWLYSILSFLFKSSIEYNSIENNDLKNGSLNKNNSQKLLKFKIKKDETKKTIIIVLLISFILLSLFLADSILSTLGKSIIQPLEVSLPSSDSIYPQELNPKIYFSIFALLIFAFQILFFIYSISMILSFSQQKKKYILRNIKENLPDMTPNEIFICQLILDYYSEKTEK